MDLQALRAGRARTTSLAYTPRRMAAATTTQPMLCTRLGAALARTHNPSSLRFSALNAPHHTQVGAPYVVVLGSKEVESGIARVKCLADGEQVEVELNDLPAWMAKKE